MRRIGSSMLRVLILTTGVFMIFWFSSIFFVLILIGSIFDQRKHVRVSVVLVKKVFNAAHSLFYAYTFTFVHAFFLHVNKLVSNAAFLKIPHGFFVSKHLFVPSICIFIISPVLSIVPKNFSLDRRASAVHILFPCQAVPASALINLSLPSRQTASLLSDFFPV